MILHAHEHVGIGFPTTEGEKLARALLKRTGSWARVEIDVTELPAGLLISAFVSGFLQHIYDSNPAKFSEALELTWNTKFDFQRENISAWCRAFRPRDPHATSQA